MFQCDEMKDIVIVTASRSECQLQEPLIKKFGDRCDVLEISCDFGRAYYGIIDCLNKEERKPKVAFCSFDRPEMLGAALAFYFNNVPIAQYHAGDFSGGETYDDSMRDMITLLSKYQFCNGKFSFGRCLRLLGYANKIINNCHEVGSMVMDGVVLDYSVVPKQSYDVVLYNAPLGASSQLIEEELKGIVDLIDESKHTIWIFPNEDFGRLQIIRLIEDLEHDMNVHGLKTLPREQYLALLEKADRVIGNSSSFFLELPLFGKKHIHIGVRNKSRDVVDSSSGAAQKMFDVIVKEIK
jgi:UDP-N-acetylglucosamine 2-epimerase (non-hydrolysing)/GDP/UDP-N,N'-diacetylbacillosamine 2-epimerase (hydrolysing)